MHFTVRMYGTGNEGTCTDCVDVVSTCVVCICSSHVFASLDFVIFLLFASVFCSKILQSYIVAICWGVVPNLIRQFFVNTGPLWILITGNLHLRGMGVSPSYASRADDSSQRVVVWRLISSWCWVYHTSQSVDRRLSLSLLINTLLLCRRAVFLFVMHLLLLLKL